MWVKLNTEIGSGTYILEHLSTGAPNYVGYYIQYEYNSGTRRLGFNRQKEGVAAQVAYYNITLGTTNFYNLTLTYDGTNVKGYVNGNYIGFLAASGDGANTYTQGEFILGCYRDAGSGSRGNYSSAIYDDVTVFSRALTATEISNLYNTNIKKYVGVSNI